MATLSLSPAPASLAVMSSRRGPLTSIPHGANSPVRASAAFSQNAKFRRSHANAQREEAYGQPPPLKKQVLDNGAGRPVRSPSKLPRSQVLLQNNHAANQSTTRQTQTLKERPASRLPTTSRVIADDDSKRQNENWKKHYRAKFPKMVFYFESVPDEVRAKLTKRITYLGARQEAFFSIEVTHVITTRPIPNGRSEHQTVEPREEIQERVTELEPEIEAQEQPQTINPSLLTNTVARRKLLEEFRSVPTKSQQAHDPSKQNRGPRNTDLLNKAREMGKRIWSLDKFQNIVGVLLEPEQALGPQASKTASLRAQSGVTKPKEHNLLQLLHNERVNGPSDRDLSTSNRDLTLFKGPYVYVWDMDERHKPVMVREYVKVANKADGDWPQFRSVGNGRCPFVEEVEIPQKPQKEERKSRQEEKARPVLQREESATMLKPPQVPAPKPLTGKRSLTEMEDGHNRIRPADILNPAKAALSKQAFVSRAEGGRLFHGEPVASGIQPSNMTSAIRSQMISSTSGLSSVKAGTSKEIHGLQRQVLQKTAPASHGTSSRLAEQSVDQATSTRSMSISRQTSRVSQSREETAQKATETVRAQSQGLKSKKDLKPGYCENCQDKYRDFDEHIVSRKHRRFAENPQNWTDLDSLLEDLTRMSKLEMAEAWLY